jgi:DNA recombination protein RmuC
MDGLARHIAQAQQDVEQVAVSARRITGRFERIEKVELEGPVASAEE